MSLRTAIYDHLGDETDITDVVSDRIYPDVAPEGADLPYITVNVVSTFHSHHMTAASGLAQARVQIDCWTTSSTGRETLSEAVREALDGYRGGSMGDDSLDVRSVHLEDDAQTYEPPTTGSDVGVFRQRMDFMIWYAESVPTF